MAVIEAENISKRYIIDHKKKTVGSVGYRDVLIHNVKSIFSNKYKKEIASEQDTKEEFWALKDVTFKIEAGDRMGIVGSNGAGKSTLLKVLSRITEPTYGKVSLKGRIASLLEVGTGFHPELTGRENVYLNGAILGMKKSEITRQFDEIVAFGGIEKFLDTPVKRYSSGMYVRLGFAIAAHLEPEILIVDEVLAVGDAEFQKKSIGKMEDVSKSGRTLIFVSHNMTAVQGLCNKSIFMQKGKMIEYGDTSHVIGTYMSKISKTSLEQVWSDSKVAPGNDMVRLKAVKVIPTLENNQTNIDVRTEIKVQVDFENYIGNSALNISLHLNSMTGETVFNVGTISTRFNVGLIRAELLIPGNFLNDGSYSISVMIVKDTSTVLFEMSEAIIFDVEDFREGTGWYGKWPGAVRPTSYLNFPIKYIDIINS
jgi:lipopolysaccharide transport system ATP-binding protein